MIRHPHTVNFNDGWSLNGKPIQLPYPPQSKLSGYTGEIGAHLVYEKRFLLPASFTLPRTFLHIGAADQAAKVFLNGKLVAEHEGGYLPFDAELTDALCDGENHLKIEVTDTLSHDYPYGKQRKDRGGMWYTPVSGIWQSVELLNLPQRYIEAIECHPEEDGVTVFVEPFEAFSVTVTLEDGSSRLYSFDTGFGRIRLEKPHFWSPSDPYLYPMQVTVGEETVESYFAIRSVAVKEVDGVHRVLLNGKPIFLHGVLDQGYFADGIYTPKTLEEYEKDILRMKELGFNLLRKHIKIEPPEFYEACDRLGMLVMQDMVNNGDYHFIRDTVLPTIGFKKRYDAFGKIKGKRKQFFIRHAMDTITHLFNHPSIIAYTIFNEGWGQFHSDAVYDILKDEEPTRLIDATSGWFAQKKSDFDSLHIYFRTVKLKPKKRPLFVTECGGYVLKLAGHCFDENKTYGYGSCKSEEELTDRIVQMYEKMILPGIPKGVCGCIYTQLSDVEEELNGLYTYDRAVCKVDKEKMRELSKRLYTEMGFVNKC